MLCSTPSSLSRPRCIFVIFSEILTFLDSFLKFSCLFNILITILLTCCSFVIDVYVNLWYFHNVFRFVFVCSVFWVEFQRYGCFCCGSGGCCCSGVSVYGCWCWWRRREEEEEEVSLFVIIRKHFVPNGEWILHPTKIGVTLSLYEWKELKKIIPLFEKREPIWNLISVLVIITPKETFSSSSSSSSHTHLLQSSSRRSNNVEIPPKTSYKQKQNEAHYVLHFVLLL